MALSRRVDWEFYAILQGRAAPVFERSEPTELRSRVLWVFAPEDLHGWIGEKNAPCRIAAFQFAFLPDQLCALTRKSRALSVPLTSRQVRQIESWVRELQPHHDEPNSISDLVAHRVMLELSLLALSAHQPDRIQTMRRVAHAKVQQALNWYGARIRENPSVTDVAAAVHVSPSYLRRLFLDVREQSPKQAFRNVQLEHVVKRITTSTARLEDVASECGFSSASELCRAFKAHFRVPPAMWRKSQLPLYREPRAKHGQAAIVRPDTPEHAKLRKYIRFT